VNPGKIGKSWKRTTNTFVTAMTLRVDVKKIVLVILIIVAAVFGLAKVFPKKESTQVVPLRLRVTVHDRATQGRVADARVTLKYPGTDMTGQAALDPALFNKVIATEQTDADGLAIVSHQFGAVVRTSLFGKHGNVVLDQNLHIDAQNYQTFEAPLATLIQQPPSFKDRDDIRVSIKLYPQQGVRP
jgi:hypothetical protein